MLTFGTLSRRKQTDTSLSSRSYSSSSAINPLRVSRSDKFVPTQRTLAKRPKQSLSSFLNLFSIFNSKCAQKPNNPDRSSFIDTPIDGVHIWDADAPKSPQIPSKRSIEKIKQLTGSPGTAEAYQREQEQRIRLANIHHNLGVRSSNS